MRTRAVLSLAVPAFIVLCLGVAFAQTPARGRGAAAPPVRAQVHANLLQVMRGILFPNSNVIFSAQTQDPAGVRRR